MNAAVDQGLVTAQSRLAFAETVATLTAEIRKRGATVFAEIDHAKGAADAGLSLRPTTVIIFGNAKGGTPLMQKAQTIGIDLPLKILMWQDEKAQVFASYNAPAWIAARHGITDNPASAAITAMLEGVTASIC
jgi:uncharacterized protein (DUF302 family)